MILVKGCIALGASLTVGIVSHDFWIGLGALMLLGFLSVCRFRNGNRYHHP